MSIRIGGNSNSNSSRGNLCATDTSRALSSGRTYAELHQVATLVEQVPPVVPFVPFVPENVPVAPHPGHIAAVDDLFQFLSVHAVEPTEMPKRDASSAVGDEDGNTETSSPDKLSPTAPEKRQKSSSVPSLDYASRVKAAGDIIESVLNMRNARQLLAPNTPSKTADLNRDKRMLKQALDLFLQLKSIDLTKDQGDELDTMIARAKQAINTVDLEIEKVEEDQAKKKGDAQAKKAAKARELIEMENAMRNAGFTDMAKYKSHLKQEKKKREGGAEKSNEDESGEKAPLSGSSNFSRAQFKQSEREAAAEANKVAMEKAKKAIAQGEAERKATERNELVKVYGEEYVQKKEADEAEAAAVRARKNAARREKQLRETLEGQQQLAEQKGFKDYNALVEAEEMQKRKLAEERKNNRLQNARELRQKKAEEKAKQQALEAGYDDPEEYKQKLERDAENERLTREEAQREKDEAKKRGKEEKIASEAFVVTYTKMLKLVSAQTTNMTRFTSAKYAQLIEELQVAKDKQIKILNAITDNSEREKYKVKAFNFGEMKNLAEAGAENTLLTLETWKEDAVKKEAEVAQALKRAQEKAEREMILKRQKEKRDEIVNAMEALYEIRWNLASDLRREAAEKLAILHTAGDVVDSKTQLDAQQCLKLPWLAGLMACLDEIKDVDCFKNILPSSPADPLTGKTYDEMVSQFEKNGESERWQMSPEASAVANANESAEREQLEREIKAHKVGADDDDGEDEDYQSDDSASSSALDESVLDENATSGEESDSDDSGSDNESLATRSGYFDSSTAMAVSGLGVMDEVGDVTITKGDTDDDEDGGEEEEEEEGEEETRTRLVNELEGDEEMSAEDNDCDVSDGGDEVEVAVGIPSLTMPLGTAVVLTLNGEPGNVPGALDGAKNSIRLALGELANMFRNIAYVLPPKVHLIYSHETDLLNVKPFFLLLEKGGKSYDEQITEKANEKFTKLKGKSSDKNYRWTRVPFFAKPPAASQARNELDGLIEGDNPSQSEGDKSYGKQMRTTFIPFGIWKDIEQWSYASHDDGKTVTVTVLVEPDWVDQWPKLKDYTLTPRPPDVLYGKNMSPAVVGECVMSRPLRRAPPGHTLTPSFGARTVPIAGKPINVPAVAGSSGPGAPQGAIGKGKVKCKTATDAVSNKRNLLVSGDGNANWADTVLLIDRMTAFLKRRNVKKPLMRAVLNNLSDTDKERLGLISIEIEPEIVLTAEQETILRSQREMADSAQYWALLPYNEKLEVIDGLERSAKGGYMKQNFGEEQSEKKTRKLIKMAKKVQKKYPKLQFLDENGGLETEQEARKRETLEKAKRKNAIMGGR